MCFLKSKILTLYYNIMAAKYKVGNIVTVKKTRKENPSAYRFTFPDHMVEEYGGESFRIVAIEMVDSVRAGKKKIPDDGYKYTLEGNPWSWASSMFEDQSELIPFKHSQVCTEDSNIAAFIKRKKCPELDFSL